MRLIQNNIYNGDCLDVIGNVDDNSIDCIICDLPYGSTNNSWDIQIPLDLLWFHYKRVLKANCAVLLFATQPFATELISSNVEWFKYEWIWLKSRPTGFLNSHKMPLKIVEYILVFYKGRATYNPQGLRYYNKTNNNGKTTTNYGKINNTKYIQEYTNYPTQILNYKYDKDKIHPTQKPVKLLEYLIKTYTKDGDLILDNCAGSGSLGVAAINTGRNYILIEKDITYFTLASARIKAHIESRVFFLLE